MTEPSIRIPGHFPIRLFLIILFSITINSLVAQVDILKYVDQNSIPLLGGMRPLKVAVKWDMDGPSQALLNEGLNNLDEGNWQQALGNFQSFLNGNYQSWFGHYYRGQALLRLGRFKEASYEFSAVNKLNPKLAEGYVELGEALEHLRDFDGAEENYKLATTTDPKFVYAYFKLGSLALSRRMVDEAIKYFKKCNKLDPKFPDAYLAEGIVAFIKDKKYDESLSLFSQALQADSTFSQANYWRGLSYLELGKKDQCLSDWSRFIRRNPRNQFIVAMRGFLKAELGDFDGAFADFRKVLQTINVNEDKFQGAQTELDKRIDLQYAANYLIRTGYGLKDEPLSNLKAGFCLLLMGDEKKAIEYIRKAEKMASSPAIDYFYAIAYEHLGVHDLAYKYYNKALEFDRDIFDAHKKRSIYLSEAKYWDLAYKDINEMFRIQPGAPVAHKLKGLMESGQAKYKEAVNDLTRYIQTDSTDTESLRTRAICFSLDNQKPMASLDITRILSLNATNETLHEKLLNDFLSIKDTLNSVFILKEYISKFPNPQAYMELAKIYIHQEKYSDALEQVNGARSWIKEREGKMQFSNGRFGMVNYSKTSSSLSGMEGLIAYNQSQFPLAIKALSRSISEDSDNQESRYLRGKCFAKMSNFKRAADDMKELKVKSYKDSDELYESFAKN